ncbi:MAG: tRNA (guanosine(46)-N7)-methyltransferase TrmB [Phycisphaerales bacterium]|nr:tRNA (guanosine(46)-N7)-methyltransferase TrmB [Phycisphaerales bacterium]
MSFGLSRGRTLDPTGSGLRGADLPPFEEGVPRIDPRSWYADPARPFELEIGSGKGTFLVQQGELQPDVNFLGIEWAGEFWRYAADRLRRRALTNVKVLHGDATEFIRYRLASGVCRVVHLYFSDPWPKTRHHKRRVVQDRTLAEFHRVLVPGGEVRIVTDHDDLWAWTEAHVARHADLFERRPFEAPASAGTGEIVGTNFERKYRREGRPFHGMTIVRRETT